MLEILTFTGVDVHTDPHRLRALADQYPMAEFAILAGSLSGGPDPLYPPLALANTLKAALDPGNIAIHLCGTMARTAASGEIPDPQLLELCAGFGRIQVNLPEQADYTAGADSLMRFADTVDAGSVILQHRSSWDKIPIPHPCIEYLFDRSGGTGLSGLHQWPPAPQGMRVGYAGGISPASLQRAISLISPDPSTRTWLDMQTKLRNRRNRFDTYAVARSCRQAFPEPETPQYRNPTPSHQV